MVALRISQGRVRVPNVVGQTRASATAEVQKAGLVAKTALVSSPKRKGTVVAQAPAAGSFVAKGSGVLLNVSGGPSTGGAAAATTAVARAASASAAAATTARHRDRPGRHRAQPGRGAAAARRRGLQAGGRLRLVGRAAGERGRAVPAGRHAREARLTRAAQRLARPEPGRAARPCRTCWASLRRRRSRGCARPASRCRSWRGRSRTEARTGASSTSSRAAAGRSLRRTTVTIYVGRA